MKLKNDVTPDDADDDIDINKLLKPFWKKIDVTVKKQILFSEHRRFLIWKEDAED